MKSWSSKSDQPTTENAEVIESLLKYPALEKVFDGAPHNYERTKQKMTETVTDLERVLRRGSRTDAEKAEKIIAAYRTALKFLDEIEQLRKQQIR
jgi:hypothetical protein